MSDAYADFASPIDPRHDPYAQFSSPIGPGNLRPTIGDGGVNPAAGNPKVSRKEAFGLNAIDALTMGTADEMADAARRTPGGTALMEPGEATGEMSPSSGSIDLGRGLAMSYAGGKGVNERLDKSRQDRPVSSLAGGVAGSTPAAMFGGEQAAGARSLASRAGMGALLGGTLGGAYGFNSGDDGRRLESAGKGAAAGAAFGAAAPVALAAARPLTKPIGALIGKAGAQISKAFAERPMASLSAAADGGAPIGRMASGGEPLRDPSREKAVSELAKLADRRNVTEEGLDDKLDQFAADPRGRLAAELFDKQGTTRLKRLAEMPGETADALAPTLRSRFQEQSARLMNDLDRAAGPTEARQAIEKVAEQKEAASRDLYKPVLAQDIDPHAFNHAATVLTHFPDSVLQRAGQAMDIVAEAEGRSPSNLTPAESLHYFKMGLDDAISSMKSNPSESGLTGNSLRAVMGLKQRYLAAVDDALPGYKNARQTWGGIKEAEDAVQRGRDLFSENPDDAIEYAKSLTPNATEFFTAGAKTAIRELLERGDKSGAEGARNVAAQFLSTNQGKRLIAALGNNAKVFTKALQGEDAGYHAAREMLPGAGSQTFRLFQDMADEEMPTSGKKLGALLGRKIGNATVDKFREGARNIQGRALMTPVDRASPSYTDEEVQRLRTLLREAIGRRTSRSAVSGAASAGAGQQAGRP